MSSTPSLAGRTAIVTGASQGLGHAIAAAYLAAGARVAICARNAKALEEARAALAKLADEDAVLAVPADVSDETAVSALVAQTVERFGGIDILVNNAGVYGPMGPTETIDLAEWRRAIDINILAVLLPVRAAIPYLRTSGHGKIVNLSGGGATQPMPRISAYATSKAAVVRLTETLALELAPDRINVNAVAPGALNTRLLDQVLDAGPAQVGEAFYAKSIQQRDNGGTSLDKGADLCVWLGSSASDGITGRLISAQWDPWPRLDTYAKQLAQSDIYTLRRIVPEDRGENDWGLP